MIPDYDLGPRLVTVADLVKWCSTRDGRRWKRVSPSDVPEYTTFFQKARARATLESVRRIPWEKINKDASDELVLCADTFCGRRDVPADYVAAAITVVQNRSPGVFPAPGPYEESKTRASRSPNTCGARQAQPTSRCRLQNQSFDKVWSDPSRRPCR